MPTPHLTRHLDPVLQLARAHPTGSSTHGLDVFIVERPGIPTPSRSSGCSTGVGIPRPGAATARAQGARTDGQNQVMAGGYQALAGHSRLHG